MIVQKLSGSQQGSMYIIDIIALKAVSHAINDHVLTGENPYSRAIVLYMPSQKLTSPTVLERSGSVVECLTRDRRAAGSSLTEAHLS